MPPKPIAVVTVSFALVLPVVATAQEKRELKAADKSFEYRIYEDAPGGHSFNRMDYPVAYESREEIYRFLAKHLGR